jgi:hypothetical protein
MAVTGGVLRVVASGGVRGEICSTAASTSVGVCAARRVPFGSPSSFNGEYTDTRASSPLADETVPGDARDGGPFFGGE